MDSVIIYSSGIDSYLLRKYLSFSHTDEKFKCVYYDIKCIYSRNEIDMIGQQIVKEPFEYIIDDTFNFKDIERSDSFIPNRNLHLLMHATKYGDKIYIGGTASDRVSDNNEKILNDLSKIVSESLDKKIVFTSPFWNVYKSQIAEWYVKDDITKKLDLVNLTFSCYTPINDKECLSCKACFRKNVVLSSIGIFRAFFNKTIIENYLHEYKSSINPNYRQIKSYEYICYLNEKM
jgi:7-cyano-7-deazaguanine synthase in queuosine biosynthesis